MKWSRRIFDRPYQVLKDCSENPVLWTWKRKKMFDDEPLSWKELELLEIAYKNSLLEIKVDKEEINEVPFVRSYYPSEEEFNDPVAYIEKIFSDDAVKAMGGCKIIPPRSFRPPCMFNPPD